MPTTPGTLALGQCAVPPFLGCKIITAREGGGISSMGRIYQSLILLSKSDWGSSLN